MGQPPYPQGPDPYGYGGDPYAQGSDPYGQQQPYYQQPAQPDVHKYPGGAQYGAQQQYGPQQYPMGPAGPPTNGTATAALVLGVAGIATCGLTSIPAIFCGHIAQSQIKRTGEGGSGMAVAGLALGYVLTIGWLLYWILIFGVMGIAIWGGGSSSTY